MTATLSRRPSAATPYQARRHVTRLTRGCDSALDLTVVVLATWTIVYHASLLLSANATWAVAAETLALVGLAIVSWSARPAPVSDAREPTGTEAVTRSSSVESLLLAATVASAVTAGLLVAIDTSWPLVAGLWSTAALTGTARAALRLQRAPVRQPTAPVEKEPGPGEATDVVVALLWASALAVLAAFTLWPNPDDLYYVNLSQWVVDHGTFPLRDTIFSDLVYPMSSWPPMASYDALVGTLARLTGVPAASVVYLVVPPVATFLSVLALWRLLRAWRVRAVGTALSVALLFLLFDGGPGYAAPGNLFLIRMWQGKVILLCLLVPVLLVYALRYVQRPTGRHAAWLFAGGVAAAALSTTAMFLVPLLAVGGAAPLVLRRPAQALRGFAAMAAYPLATGVVTVAVGGRSADLFEARKLYRFEPEWFGHEIFRSGPLAAIAVTAVLAGALLVPHPAARLTTGVLAVITGVTFVPGVTHLSYDLVGLGPTLWRVSWLVTIAALVGVLATQLGAQLGARLGARRPSLRLGPPVALGVVFVAFGLPIWSPSNGVAISSPPHWQRSPESTDTAQRAIAAVDPGDLVLAAEDVAITIDVLTTEVKTVAPRAYFMDYLRDDPSFHFDERSTLIDFANAEVAGAGNVQVARALSVLDVDEVCLPLAFPDRITFLRTHGYRSVTSSAADRCLTR